MSDGDPLASAVERLAETAARQEQHSRAMLWWTQVLSCATIALASVVLLLALLLGMLVYLASRSFGMFGF